MSIGENILENPAQVYLYATNKLLLRNVTLGERLQLHRINYFFYVNLLGK